MEVAPPLADARPSLQSTIGTISELAQRIYSGREEILRLLEQPLVSPELHGLFPAGVAETLHNYTASMLFVTNALQAPTTKLMDYMLTLRRTL